MKCERLLDIIGEIDDKYIAEAAPAARKSRRKSVWAKCGTIAACLVMLLSVTLGTFAVVAEAAEYKAAVQFFNDYDMSTEGLTRGEIKAVYRDITTKSFTYSKTAEVIRDSISADNIGGYEITQDDPTPEDIENLWNYKNYTDGFIGSTQTGVHYEYHSEGDNKSRLEKYDDDELIWSVSVPNFSICQYHIVSDGVIVYGNEFTAFRDPMRIYAWIAKIDLDGNLVWDRKLGHGYNYEYVSAVIENNDGSYSVFSGSDGNFFCLTQYAADGTKMNFHKTDVGSYRTGSAARFGDGYIVQLVGKDTQIVKVDYEGNITDSFSYDDENFRYSITDMIEFNGNIYLSAYAVPRSDRYELAEVVQYLDEQEFSGHEISSEELTQMIRDYYTAILLVCDPETGTPQEFYSIKGSLGGKLSVSDAGSLIWDVERITSTFYSPATSSFGFGGVCYVFRYAFDTSGFLMRQEKTDEVVHFQK